jgi:adenine-specific DNA-methyltransferase
VIDGPPAGSYWRVNKERFQELVGDNRIWWGKGDVRPGIKRFLSEVRAGVVPQTLWSWKDAGSTRNAKQELSEIMSAEANEDLFLTPKPSRLLQRILQIATDKDSIVLDSFAGSGTTAHAVLALNKEDGGNRRFILVESEDYVDRLTTERVRRVIRGVPKAKDENLREGLGGTFSYFKLGKPLRLRAILEGSALPDYELLASYVFFTATGEEFDAKKIDKKTWFIGESRHHDVFLLYEQDAEKLKQIALTLDVARALPSVSVSGKPKLVFAPTKYLDPYFLDRLRITFQQLPYQIYKALET